MTTVTKLPSINVYGLGGCGINVINQLINADDQPVDNKDIGAGTIAHTYVLDTSMSNLQKYELPKEVIQHLISEEGAGKNRAVLKKDIIKYIERNKSDLVDDAADINILVFSLAGGSGSVIGPILAKEFVKHNHAVIIMGVVDTTSKMDTENSIATMKELDADSNELHQVYPVVLFDNTAVGRRKVNTSVVNRIEQCIMLFSSPDIEELDYNDRMHFLRPTDVHTSFEGGLHMLGISASKFEDTEALPGEVRATMEPGDTVEAYIHVSEDGLGVDLLATTSYIGIIDMDKQPANIFAVIGVPVASKFIVGLNDTMNKFTQASFVTNSSIQDTLK